MSDTANAALAAGSKSKIEPAAKPKFGFVVSWLCVLAIFMVGMAIGFGPTTPDRLISCVICATGFLVGVAVGIFLSPFNLNEKEAFQAYGKAISALITGWLLAKSDDLVKAIINPNLLHGSGLGALRLLLFGVGVIGAAVVVFYHRRYIAVRSDVPDNPANTSKEHVPDAPDPSTDTSKPPAPGIAAPKQPDPGVVP